jgi:hypothetical protein
MSSTNAMQPEPLESERTFFQALFDFKFTEWVTLRVAGVLYLGYIVLISLAGIIGLIGLLLAGTEFALVILYLLLGALVWLLLVLIVRVTFEGWIATIAVAQNTASLRK